MGNVIGGYDVDTQERVLLEDKDDAGLNAEFMRDVKQTPAGKRLFADFMSEDNYIAVLEAVGKLYPNADCITVSMFADSADTLMLSGEIQPTSEPAVPAVEPAPTDKNGRTLSAAQIQWGRFVVWSQTASSAQIKERVRTDEAYARFHRSNLKKEMNLEPVQDSVLLYNPHLMREGGPSQTAMKDERLVAFANRYKQMSSEDVRKAKRLDYSPLSARQFCLDETACIDAGLI